MSNAKKRGRLLLCASLKRQAEGLIVRELFNCMFGAGSITNIYPHDDLELEELTLGQSADSDAIRGDWEKVGNDLRYALDRENDEQRKNDNPLA